MNTVGNLDLEINFVMKKRCLNLSSIAQTFPDDQMTEGIVEELPPTDHKEQISSENCASNILRCHYGTLSQSLQYPVRVAQLLYEEGVISKARFTIVKYTAKSQSTRKALFVLLCAIRHAVHIDYHNLMILGSVLLKFTSNVPCAKAILKDYGKCRDHCIIFKSIHIEKAFFEDRKVQHVNTGVIEGIVYIVHENMISLC